MLSIKTFKSSDNTSNYYSHGDYYGSEGEGSWLGEGAKDLSLNGDFTAKNDKQFNNLLNGILPSGQQLGKKTKDGIEHRPGTDLTFSAPKSFSIQMLVYSNKEEREDMEKALMNAVSNTLGYIEKQGYVIARKGKGGGLREKITKLTFASFMHTTNRNLEPQAHVHCFLANAAKCQDGKYRSITIDNLLENNKFFGQVFRNELALETTKLGHEVKTTILSDGSSSFEIAKIDEKLIKAFSTRRKEIEELFKLHGASTKEARDKIVIHSRKAKKFVTQEELAKAWAKIEKSITKEPINFIEHQPQQNPISARDIVFLSMDSISSNKTIFSQEELLKNTLNYSIGDFSIDEISKEIKIIEQEGLLIKRENYFTTKALLDKERQIIKYAESALGKSKQIIKEKHFDNHLQKFEKREYSRNPDFQMNNQQKKAIKHLLISQDKIMTMDGLPGVGKSTVLNAVRDISGRKIINLLGFGESFEGSAPTASATKTLKESAGVKSQTLHSFLAKYQGYIEDRGTKSSLQALRNDYKKTVIFLDESSLVSTNIMYKLLKLQEKFGFRLVLTGDTKQLESVEAGKPFEQMLKVIKPVKIQEIVRQKDALHKQAVIQASQGNIEKTFAIHDQNIKESSSKMLVESASQLYLEKDKMQRDKTLLLSPTRDLRDKINDRIRAGLALKGEEHNFTVLRQKNMTKMDHSFAPAFGVGDTIKFNTKYKNGINKGDYLKVKSINSITNSLVFEKDNKELIFHLNKNVDYSNKIEVFSEVNLKLQEGLKLIFTKNNKELGLINSETAIVQNIAKDNILLELEDGKIKSIPRGALKHIDYGYCVTIHASQGKTFDSSIAAISNNKLLNNQRSWLVALSRHRNEFTALVENKNVLKTYLMKNKGIELSAIEFNQTLDNPANSLKNEANNAKINNESKLQAVI